MSSFKILLEKRNTWWLDLGTVNHVAFECLSLTTVSNKTISLLPMVESPLRNQLSLLYFYIYNHYFQLTYFVLPISDDSSIQSFECHFPQWNARRKAMALIAPLASHPELNEGERWVFSGLLDPDTWCRREGEARQKKRGVKGSREYKSLLSFLLPFPVNRPKRRIKTRNYHLYRLG